MHTLTQKLKNKIHGYPVDGGTKAGVMAIYHHTGELKSVSQLRSLSPQEQHFFHEGVMEYIENNDHPAKSQHPHVQYGRMLYYLSLTYFLSLTVWLALLIDHAISLSSDIRWDNVWMWIIVVSLINIVLTFYGIHLELKAYQGRLTNSRRIMAALAIIALAIAIVGNFVMPSTLNSGTTPFTVSADSI